jgi:hypothetical protein
MSLDAEHESMLVTMLAANEVEREVTAGCPDGRSKWHTAYRLRTEGLAFLTETDVHRVGAALQRRGLVSHKTQYGTTRWTLTEHGAREARRLARSVRS